MIALSPRIRERDSTSPWRLARQAVRAKAEEFIGMNFSPMTDQPKTDVDLHGKVLAYLAEDGDLDPFSLGVNQALKDMPTAQEVIENWCTRVGDK